MRKATRYIAIIMAALLLTAANKAEEKKRSLRILFQGDSITDGNWGKNNSRERTSDPNHIFGHGYMFICAATYTAEYPDEKYRFFNRGISGHEVVHLQQRWEKDALDINPDVLSILVGINDVASFLRDAKPGQKFDFEKWEADYRSLLDRSLAINPNLKIVLGEPFVGKVGNRISSDWKRWEKITKGCGEVVRKIADDYSATFLPYFSMFEEATERAPIEYWLWDGVHPTAAGHKLMADLWMEKVGKL